MKRQYMNYMKSNLLAVIACFISIAGAAQGFSPAAMEQLKYNDYGLIHRTLPVWYLMMYKIIRMSYWDMIYRTETIVAHRKDKRRLS